MKQLIIRVLNFFRRLSSTNVYVNSNIIIRKNKETAFFYKKQGTKGAYIVALQIYTMRKALARWMLQHECYGPGRLPNNGCSKHKGPLIKRGLTQTIIN